MRGGNKDSGDPSDLRSVFVCVRDLRTGGCLVSHIGGKKKYPGR